MAGIGAHGKAAGRDYHALTNQTFPQRSKEHE
jgi:hypothetical protein